MGLERYEHGTLWAGQLTHFTFPGGYSVIYFTEDGGILCAKCANGENGSDAYEEQPLPPHPDFFHDPQWHLIAADVYWEGPDMFCDHCNEVMPSEYGGPDAEEEETNEGTCLANTRDESDFKLD